MYRALCADRVVPNPILGRMCAPLRGQFVYALVGACVVPAFCTVCVGGSSPAPCVSSRANAAFWVGVACGATIVLGVACRARRKSCPFCAVGLW